MAHRGGRHLRGIIRQYHVSVINIGICAQNAEVHARLATAATENRDVLKAAKAGDLATLEMLALLAPEAIEKRNAYGSTALVLSCRHASLPQLIVDCRC